MDREYYIDMAGKTAGPFTVVELKAMYERGAIGDATLFAREGASEWRTMSILAPLFRDASEGMPPVQDLPAEDPRPLVSREAWFCMRCHEVIQPYKKWRGSVLIELLCLGFFGAMALGTVAVFGLLGFLAVPLLLGMGLVYTAWRWTSRVRCCPCCEAEEIIPATAPAASQYVRLAEPERTSDLAKLGGTLGRWVGRNG